MRPNAHEWDLSAQYPPPGLLLLPRGRRRKGGQGGEDPREEEEAQGGILGRQVPFGRIRAHSQKSHSPDQLL